MAIKSKIHTTPKKKLGPKIAKIVKKKKLDPTFEPRTKTLSRILKTIIDHGPESKSTLSFDTNLNYARLAKHIVWLEKKGLVESKIKDSTIKIDLTEKGKLFASIISD
jgi:predicted transcriptional regulator